MPNLLQEDDAIRNCSTSSYRKRKSTSSRATKPSLKNKKTAELLHDLFGTDSEDEETPPPPTSNLPTVFCRRVANGVTKQISNSSGDFYVEIKLYEASEVEKVAGEDRWRHAIVSAKTKLKHGGREWDLLQKLVTELKTQFADSTPVLIKNKE